jgi:hypothetical protein
LIDVGPDAKLVSSLRRKKKQIDVNHTREEHAKMHNNHCFLPHKGIGMKRWTGEKYFILLSRYNKTCEGEGQLS